jgi:hypothetical protein
MNPLIRLQKIYLVCVAVLGCYGLPPALNANTITVTNTNDSGPGSLREALALANDGDTINATGVSGTILLTSGALQITHNVTINGPGAGNLAINGNARFTVFQNNFVSGVTISGFTITNGKGSGILNQASPGFFFGSQAELTLSRCSVVGNIGVGIGNSAIVPNSNTGNALATLTITNSTVSGNSGGGISNLGVPSRNEGSGHAELTVRNCTISGNSASNGGGIYNEAGGGCQGCGHGKANVVISNSTLSGNSATGNGGAIYNAGFASVSVKNSTISGNSAPNGGGIFLNGGGLELGSTILKAGSSGENIFKNFGRVTSLGYNLASDNGGGVLRGPGDQINTHPLLGPLRDNGGPTFTHALLHGSPAIDAGNPNVTAPHPFDQRGPGYPRVVDGRIDIGSFEVQAAPTPTPTAP